jgi:histidinol-phosphate aminotransferase
MDELPRSYLRWVNQYRPGKPVDEIKRIYGLSDAVRLCSNENPWPLPEEVIQAILKASGEVQRYPDPEAYLLKRALSKHLGVSPAEVVVGGGTEGVLCTLFQALVEVGDRVVIPQPTYPVYALSVAAAGGECDFVPLLEDFSLPIDRVVSACGERTKAVVICNPNNPTGNILERQDLLNLAVRLEERKTLLVVDEAYAEYVSDPRYLCGVELFRQLSNVVILRTFSKIYGLAGLRIGYAIAPKPIAEAFGKVRRVFSVNAIGQAAAIAALGCQDHISSIRDRTILERDRMHRVLCNMGVRVHNTHANFLLISLTRANDIYEALLAKGVIVRNGEDLGLEGTIRVTVGLPEENDRFLKEFDRVLRRLGG